VRGGDLMGMADALFMRARIAAASHAAVPVSRRRRGDALPAACDAAAIVEATTPMSMTDADPPPRITIDPPIAAWRMGETSPSQHDARRELAPLLDTLGLHDATFDPARPIIAAGHQAWFWHPGILAKDFALAAACARLGAQAIHLVVDHIANPALTIDVPVRRGDALYVEPLRLGDENLAVGTGRRPPLSRAQLAEAIYRLRENAVGEIAVDLDRLLDVPPGFDALRSLSDSITAMQLHAVQAWCPNVFVLRTSQLARLASFQTLAKRMLHDARACVAAYNDAVGEVPAAGVAPLLVERDRVELPLWVIETAGTLGRVFADLADATPMLTREDGTPIKLTTTDGVEHLPLAPKALTLTAFMRSTMCDLFIHGTGGAVYEQVTEHWWDAWTAQPLAPLTVVSADVTLNFTVPVATKADLQRAVWFRHHLPHNIDRYMRDPSELDPALLAEKRALLQGDPAAHDKPTRRAARRRLRAINRILTQKHHGLIDAAEASVVAARQGVANASAAARRDWCFQLHPPEKLAALRQAISDSA